MIDRKLSVVLANLKGNPRVRLCIAHLQKQGHRLGIRYELSLLGLDLLSLRLWLRGVGNLVLGGLWTKNFVIHFWGIADKVVCHYVHIVSECS